METFNNKEILITGGCGTLGKAVTDLLLEKYTPRGIRLYSRDEYKQWIRKKELNRNKVAFLVGNIRDKQRLNRAMKGVDCVINTAALKHIDSCELNPFEAVRTNIDGVENIIDCAIDNDVEKIMHISTDKAVYPTNLYGMTKAVGERLITTSSIYCGGRIKMSCCRYGNVLGSRGSIIELFNNQLKENKSITITHPGMTRFWIEIEKVAWFILDNILRMEGNEIFVPKMPSMKILDIVKSIDPYAKTKIIGMREGEKLHECLITEEESYNTKILDDKYVISKTYHNPIPFTYTSKDNHLWLTDKDIKEKLEKLND
eukprot:GHVU01188638.1.p1 GENE.GHVU01188638.1~~GHVU01188638.1.p1  ORF type:complete len:315 (-),score=34.59 GHVU01188638.1:1529-2473(-)